MDLDLSVWVLGTIILARISYGGFVHKTGTVVIVCVVVVPLDEEVT